MEGLSHIELLRRGVGLAPEPGSGQTGGAIHVEPAEPGRRALVTCPCAASRERRCDHARDLSRARARLGDALGGRSWDDVLAASPWYRLARLVAPEGPVAAADVHAVEVEVRDEASDGTTALHLTTRQGVLLAVVLAEGGFRWRFLERAGLVPEGRPGSDRAGLLHRLAVYQMSDAERRLHAAGARTRREAWEESLLYRLAYHCVREGGEDPVLAPAVDLESGEMTVVYRVGGRDAVRLVVPRDRVRAVLRLVAELHPGREDLQIRPVPLRTIFHVTAATELDLDVRPGLLALQASGEAAFLSSDEVRKFRYGDLVYLAPLGVLAELEKDGSDRRFRAPERVRLARSQMPAFLDRHRVVHYDRWWNAAREDQATDRVHRLGQTRGVQVFKLVTEGTLEERIAEIVERKRQLLDEVVEEDDPRLGKAFTREEILELLRPL